MVYFASTVNSNYSISIDKMFGFSYIPSMITIKKLYPLLKDICIDDKKNQEIIEGTYHSQIEQETKVLIINETFLPETTSLR
jgi:hypothetical protein